MKNLLAFLPAFMLLFASCATPERCAQYCYSRDSSIITVYDTVVQVQIVPDSAQAAAPAPCPDIDTITAHTANATARAWVADSTLHVDVSQQGTAPATIQHRSSDTIRYRYIHIPCPDDMARWKYLLALLLAVAIVAVFVFFKAWR
jgi:hypothetical protein